MDFIYRTPGQRGAKSLSLHRVADYMTGLSFLDYQFGLSPIRFRVQTLKENGFVVLPDSQEWCKTLPFFGRERYLYYDDYLKLPLGHVTVYHSDFDYWQAWHHADLANLHSEAISSALSFLYALRSYEEG